MPKRKPTVKDGFTFFRSYWEAMEDLPLDTQKMFALGVVYYAFKGDYPDFITENKFAYSLLKAIIPVLNTSIKRSLIGSKGGKQNGSKTEAKVKQKLSHKDKDKDKELFISYETNNINKKDKEAEIAKGRNMGLFEECWKNFGNYGAKKKAEEYWSKLSEEDQQAIKERIPVYLEHLSQTGYSKKMFQGWINPKERMWETTYENTPQQNKQSKPQQIDPRTGLPLKEGQILCEGGIVFDPSKVVF